MCREQHPHPNADGDGTSSFLDPWAPNPRWGLALSLSSNATTRQVSRSSSLSNSFYLQTKTVITMALNKYKLEDYRNALVARQGLAAAAAIASEAAVSYPLDTVKALVQVRSRKKKILRCCVHVWKLFLFFSIYLETAEEYCALCPYMFVFVNTPLIPWGSGVCQCRQEWSCKWRQSLGDGSTGDESWSARCTVLFFSLKSLKQTYYSPFSMPKEVGVPVAKALQNS